MTQTEKYFVELSSNLKDAFAQVFGNPEMFYKTAYLIAKNEHLTSLDKNDQWEQKIEIIHYYQNKLKEFLNNLSLDGENLMADIASDYFEDYVHYRDNIDFGLSNEEFLSVLKEIQHKL